VEGTLQDALKTQPSLLPRRKSSRTSLHYVIQSDGAHDLVLPPWGHVDVTKGRMGKQPEDIDGATKETQFRLTVFLCSVIIHSLGIVQVLSKAFLVQ